jgi:hypothetical protein
MPLIKKSVLLENFKPTFESLPVIWTPYFTESEEVYTNMTKLLNHHVYEPSSSYWWSFLRDLDPIAVKVIFITDRLHSNNVKFLDGLAFSSGNSKVPHPVTELMLDAMYASSISSPDILYKNLGNSLRQNRMELSDWSFENLKVQGVLLLPIIPTFDKFRFSETSLSWPKVMSGLINTFLRKNDKQPIVVVLFGESSKTQINIKLTPKLKRDNLLIIESVDILQAQSNYRLRKSFLSHDVFNKIQTFQKYHNQEPTVFS